jgi:hypothetical protein
MIIARPSMSAAVAPVVTVTDADAVPSLFAVYAIVFQGSDVTMPV